MLLNMWPRFPYHEDSRAFSDGCGGPTAGISEPGSIIERHAYDREAAEEFYVPTEDDLELMRTLFGSATPSWDKVQSKLVRGGQQVGSLRLLSMEAIIDLLRSSLENDPNAVKTAREYREKRKRRAEMNDAVSMRTRQLADAWGPLERYDREGFRSETGLDPDHSEIFGGKPSPSDYWAKKAELVSNVAKFISGDSDWLEIFSSVERGDEWMDAAVAIIRESMSGRHDKVKEWLREFATSGTQNDTLGNKVNAALVHKLPNTMLQMNHDRILNQFRVDEALKPEANVAQKARESGLALIMKGGGIKGLAYIGAVERLEEKYDFNWFIGTSAGAVTAILLGAGYSVEELKTILRNKDFRDFLDAPVHLRVPNLIFHKGMHKAEAFTDWMDTLLATKLDKKKRVRLSDLPNRVTVYASRRDKEVLKFDSLDADADAAFAARCSMSIPYYFTPQSDQGFRTFDGGIQNNYPLELLLRDSPRTPFISLFLGSEVYEPTKQGSVIFDLLHIVTEASDREVVEKHRERTVIIDPRPIRTLDFGLSEVEKDYLLEAGRTAALAHLETNSPAHQSARSIRDELKSKVESSRKTRKRKKGYRRLAWTTVVLFAAVLWCFRANLVDWTTAIFVQKLEGTGRVESLIQSLNEVAKAPNEFISSREGRKVRFSALLLVSREDDDPKYYQLDVVEDEIISSFLNRPNLSEADRRTVAEMKQAMALSKSPGRFNSVFVYPQEFESVTPGVQCYFEARLAAITPNPFGTFPAWTIEFCDAERLSKADYD